MDDEGDESRIGSMDLNLYLGLPRSPGPRVLDLGSDLALGSILVPSSPSGAHADANAGDSHSVMDIGGPEPYSPSNASYDAVQPSSEHTPYTPSYQPIGPSYIPIPPIDEEEEADDPYSPSDVQPLQFSREEANESMPQDGVSHSLYGSASPPGLVDEPHVPYSPPYVPLLATPQGHNVPTSLNGDESSGRADGSSSQRDSIQYPVLRFRRLIESQDRLRLRRRYRSSFAISSERPDVGWHYQSTIPESPAQESLGKNKVAEERVVTEGSEEDSEDKSKGAANFECNICFELAKEPVVTSCGHLFCWPCLYQWLHLHSEHKECPVCKGEVTESNITPIYGRGSSEAGQESKHGEDGQHGLKIPPRPRGNRLESFRQHFRPSSTRRLGDGSWRRLFDARLPNSDRFEGHVDPSMHDMFDIGQPRLLARLRSDMMQRRERNLERRLNTGDNLLHRNVTPEPQNNHSSLPTQDGAADLWPRFSLYDLGRVVERLASSTNRYGASGSSVSPPNLEPPIGRASVAAAIAADQASASSTMAVIQGDVAAHDGAVEPNRAGSSRSLRRRGRSSTSGSLDVDGGALHVRKRRRLN